MPLLRRQLQKQKRAVGVLREGVDVLAVHAVGVTSDVNALMVYL
jgi:hypothetical protein